jgi:LacI family transcriptional regulator
LELRSVRTRKSAFLKCLEKCGIIYDEQLMREGNYRIDGGQKAMSSLLHLQDPPTAVMTSNDLTAIGAMRAIYCEGLRVPEDISVVGFDDIDLSQYTQPPVTTVRLSRSELGETAFSASRADSLGPIRSWQRISSRNPSHCPGIHRSGASGCEASPFRDSAG